MIDGRESWEKSNVVKTCNTCKHRTNCGYVDKIKEEEPNRASDKFKAHHNCMDWNKKCKA